MALIAASPTGDEEDLGLRVEGGSVEHKTEDSSGEGKLVERASAGTDSARKNPGIFACPQIDFCSTVIQHRLN